MTMPMFLVYFYGDELKETSLYDGDAPLESLEGYVWRSTELPKMLWEMKQ